MSSKRVAVIGAGPSGLVTVKELLQQGHQPVCFERASGLGGVFRFGETDGVVWESCRLTSSGLLTAFSDFPVSKPREQHMAIGEYVRYLEEYCEHFGVKPHLRFGTSVTRVSRMDCGSWEVHFRNGQETSCEVFDAVAVCSGLHQHPRIPDFPGQETFVPELVHGSRYRRGSSVTDKKVLIVGAGESGADVAAEVAENASETVLSLRRGVAVVSRCAFGKPRDYLTSRIANGASHWVFQTRNPEDNRKRDVYRLVGFPVVVLDKLLQWFSRIFWEDLPLLTSVNAGERRVRKRMRSLQMQLLRESGGTLMEQFGTKDDAFLRAMALGTCRRAPAVRKLEGHEVIFEDGSRFAPDLVILCTGFETRMPFLEDVPVSEQRYCDTFAPHVGPSLGFIGFVRPGFGAIPPLAELQARWFALIQSGARQLPSASQMQSAIQEREAARQAIFRVVGQRLPHLVDFTVCCDELADQVGCKPGKSDLEGESRKFRFRFHAGPFVAAQYRLMGPGARPSLAREVIEGLPVAHPLPDLVNFYLRWSMSRMLYRLKGAGYAPKLIIR